MPRLASDDPSLGLTVADGAPASGLKCLPSAEGSLSREQARPYPSLSRHSLDAATGQKGRMIRAGDEITPDVARDLRDGPISINCEQWRRTERHRAFIFSSTQICPEIKGRNFQCSQLATSAFEAAALSCHPYLC
ncbi:hypothetical protein PoB_002634300 [Plakobranchus ocellatus]|uniref:Uncharacterized protein n=1 Tax=Plakobranchus ocellatus TaxID=259542 RepID=A0AAV3ZZH3_9GAST|nr:hypothetical protein PoB_002634300 [Plakobranchus ocellatus]